MEAHSSAFDRELWVVFSGFCHFWYLLEGQQFHAPTDRKPLTVALHRVLEWTTHLPWVLSGLSAAPKEDNSLSSVEMVYRAAFTLPG
jgi:hypothetical protein